MSSRFFIRKLTPRNFLSFGPEFEGIELGPLNVLIGANGCGKSNLIEAVSFMRGGTGDFRDVPNRGGGAKEWIWKGNPVGPASIEWEVDRPSNESGITHSISFATIGHEIRIQNEQIVIHGDRANPGSGASFQRLSDGAIIERHDGLAESQVQMRREQTYQSLLSVVFDLDLAKVEEEYKSIRLFREWAFGRNAACREPQRADERNDKLAENFSNLGMFLSRLRTQFPAAKRAILNKLKELYDGITDFEISAAGGTVQVYFTEGEFSIPATRLSDGTLRYLCLLAILCDPEPPPLICIEEPELGLHPDILPTVADLLREASKRTQLIVTTHSEILVDSMTESPESVVVCSKEDGQTKMERLDPKRLADWLENYRLGRLWTSGRIGGTRW